MRGRAGRTHRAGRCPLGDDPCRARDRPGRGRRSVRVRRPRRAVGGTDGFGRLGERGPRRRRRAPTAVAVGHRRSRAGKVGAVRRRARLTGGKAVALTFDDGPHPTWTPKVLDLLRAARRQGDVLRGRRAGAAHPRAGAADRPRGPHAVQPHLAARARPRHPARRARSGPNLRAHQPRDPPGGAGREDPVLPPAGRHVDGGRGRGRPRAGHDVRWTGTSTRGTGTTPTRRPDRHPGGRPRPRPARSSCCTTAAATGTARWPPAPA